jgi:hypothetical protein
MENSGTQALLQELYSLRNPQKNVCVGLNFAIEEGNLEL